MQQDKCLPDVSSFLQLAPTSDEEYFVYYATRLVLSCQRLYGIRCSIAAHLTQEIAAMTQDQVQLSISTRTSFTEPASCNSSDWIIFPIQWDNVLYGTLRVRSSEQTISFTIVQRLTYLCAWLLRTLEDAAYVQRRRSSLTNESLQNIATLTPREIEVLKLMISGNSTDNITQKLVLSKRTVEKHQRSIYERLNVNSSQDAIFVGIAAGFE